METRDRAKARHTSVETEPRPRHENNVSRHDTCLETPSLIRAIYHYYPVYASQTWQFRVLTYVALCAKWSVNRPTAV